MTCQSTSSTEQANTKPRKWSRANLCVKRQVTTHVQADEIRAKGRKVVIWMGMAIDATSRLWLAGAVSVSRDRQLADRLLQQVRRCCQCVQGLLICPDGWVTVR